MTTTFDGIRAIIVRDFELPPERLRRDTLLEDIELDSLAITELVFSIEDEFRITAENTIPPFETLGDIADYVARLVAERDTKPRVAAKSAGNGASAADKPSQSTRSAHRKSDKRANGASRANAASAGGARRTKPGVAKRQARAASRADAPPRKPKGSGGSRVGTRAR